ncbi:SDR family oxidoreductase [Ornithinicoccus hortensis]|uniref:NAD(P)-dependent dehydrogenase (Short-subunit alcohol dehydrogenase family) n=1 Tax=Ornithinicoccus hortensis TaxID=82346 RepID=A0A542YWM4_9MICO|nr:SDR family oxidoreductase [Ornithinicoccus hortensis]TQL52485.1 NAD(P)-dependent dehydrogenase (short-subunit alcohol dehydrogenase family) [Ornithinicoccus hortensis]
MNQIQHSRTVVTGGGSGLGLRIAQVFRDAGADVLVSDISDGALATARDEGFEVTVCDVSEEAQVEAMVQVAVERLGGLDVLVNNAGMAGPTGPVEGLDSEAWRRTFDVNIHGQFYCVKHALPHLRRSADARIINLSSAAGRLGMAGRSPYSASKWAVVGFTKTLAIELGPDGIAVNAICPGAVDGPRIQAVIEAKAQMLDRPVEEVTALYHGQSSLGRLVTADDIAAAALYLAGPAGRMVSGQALAIDGNTEKLY